MEIYLVKKIFFFWDREGKDLWPIRIEPLEGLIITPDLPVAPESGTRVQVKFGKKVRNRQKSNIFFF